MSNEQWPHEDTQSLDACYGDPRGRDGEASPRWILDNLILWRPPYPLFYSDGKKTPLTHLRLHKKCADTFTAAFSDVFKTLSADYIAKNRLDITGGAFCYRLQRGGSRLSVHSWGCAIDMDPAHNPFPHKWVAGQGMIDARFAQIMQAHGFTWRGANFDNDPMHFQLCHRG
jgi:hypothetical protein